MRNSARFVLALLPALAFAQDVYTLSQTVVVTNPQFTLTESPQNSPHVATRTIIITAPIDEITSIADSIPKSIQVQQTQLAGGQVLPITINTFVTSILIPAAASIPTGITLSPISPVLVPVPTVSQVVSALSNSLDAGASSVSAVVVSGKHRRFFVNVQTSTSTNQGL